LRTASLLFLSALAYAIHTHLIYPTSLILPCSANLAWSRSTSLNPMTGGTRSSFGVTTDVSRTNGRAVHDDRDAGFVSTVRVERMGGLAKIWDFEGTLMGITIGDVSREASWGLVGCNTAFGGYRETNDRSNARAPSMSPDLRGAESSMGCRWSAIWPTV
jgi:hypothetical protein